MIAMGLDGVEIIMECEDEFGIRIPDADASRARTVADLYALICRLRDRRVLQPPPAALVAIGEALRETGIEQGAPDPSARLADLVPKQQRRAFWSAMERRLGPLPDLVRPRLGCLWASVITAICALAGALAFWPGFIAGVVLGLVIASVVDHLMRRLDPEFPTDITTVKDPMVRPDAMSALEIWQKLVVVIAGQLGIRPEEVTLEKRFIEDLHVG